MSKRNIFEEVSSDVKPKADRVKEKQASAKHDQSWRKPASLWLQALFLLVALMIIVGGLTRLTDSGLSITEWKPISGVVPPMGEAAWASEFAKYQESPEYQLQNKGMSLEAFKFIFFWEWGHRFLGRFVGLIWAVGFAALLVKNKLPAVWKKRFLLIGALGGLQGVIGWWMVSSGLQGDNVDVASYRLATHLGLAFAILGLISWYYFMLQKDEVALLQSRRQRHKTLSYRTSILMILVFTQILLGALVAGIDAGRGHTDWPLMAGEIFPSDSFDITPLWRNFFENPALVQFNHRVLGYIVAIYAIFVWQKSRAHPVEFVRGSYSVMLAFLALQILLGIVTVMSASPLSLAILHQIGAILLFAMVIRARFNVMYPPEQSIRKTKS